MSGTPLPSPTVPPVLTPVEEKRIDKNRLLTAIMKLCDINPRLVKTSPIVLSLKQAGIIGFNSEFVHMTAANIDALQYMKGADLVPLEMSNKMQLRALLDFYHHESAKNHGGINILESTSGQFKQFRNTIHNPTQEIVPWAIRASKNESLSNWNKMVKPSARDYKPFREANNWVDYKDGFLVTLEAQNLTHLIDPKHSIVDAELNEAQRKFLYTAMKDSFLHHEAKSIIKFHSKDKDTRTIWEKICKTYDESIATSMNGDAIMAWLTSVKLDTCNSSQTYGEFVTFYQTQVLKFNKMRPDSHISEEQAVRMLQNVRANTPSLGNVLNLYRQTKKAAGQPITITLREYVALLAQQAQVVDSAKIRTGRNNRRSAAIHETEYESNAHDFDPDDDADLDLDTTVSWR